MHFSNIMDFFYDVHIAAMQPGIGATLKKNLGSDVETIMSATFFRTPEVAVSHILFFVSFY